jgi:heparanase 1
LYFHYTHLWQNVKYLHSLQLVSSKLKYFTVLSRNRPHGLAEKMVLWMQTKNLRKGEFPMAQFVNLNPGSLRELHVGNERLVSYNVEMTEVTGGTFWKAYTPAQIAGTEPFVLKGGFLGNATASTDLMQYYDPIDLSDKKLRKLAKEIGPAWVRVSGTWSTKTYYDFDGHTNGVIPEGYNAILTREQWLGVLDFCKDIGAKLLISVADCEGLHHADEPWNPSQAEQIFALSKEYGKAIDATEFVNEPNLLAMSGCPKGYTAEQYVRDQDIFIRWLHENYPDCPFVGPCSTEGVLKKHGEKAQGGGVGDILPQCSTDDLMKGAQEKLDVYSYHYYNGVSERLEPVMPFAHWKADKAHTEEYLAVASNMAKFHAEKRDIYCPGGEMWVTEAGDAGGGGDTWASTYLDVFRTLNELGSFSVVTRGIIFHNTLASSDYGYLKPEVFDPRPNYFAVLLWNRLMGTTVYDAAEPIREGAHVYAHSRADGKPGKAYLVINNSLTDTTTVTLPKEAEVYQLSAETLRSQTMLCNGKALVLGEGDALPEITPAVAPAGELVLPAATCTFIVL